MKNWKICIKVFRKKVNPNLENYKKEQIKKDEGIREAYLLEMMFSGSEGGCNGY